MLLQDDRTKAFRVPVGVRHLLRFCVEMFFGVRVRLWLLHQDLRQLLRVRVPGGQALIKRDAVVPLTNLPIVAPRHEINKNTAVSAVFLF